MGDYHALHPSRSMDDEEKDCEHEKTMQVGDVEFCWKCDHMRERKKRFGGIIKSWSEWFPRPGGLEHKDR